MSKENVCTNFIAAEIKHNSNSIKQVNLVYHFAYLKDYRSAAFLQFLNNVLDDERIVCGFDIDKVITTDGSLQHIGEFTNFFYVMKKILDDQVTQPCVFVLTQRVKVDEQKTTTPKSALLTQTDINKLVNYLGITSDDIHEFPLDEVVANTEEKVDNKQYTEMLRSLVMKKLRFLIGKALKQNLHTIILIDNSLYVPVPQEGDILHKQDVLYENNLILRDQIVEVIQEFRENSKELYLNIVFIQPRPNVCDGHDVQVMQVGFSEVLQSNTID